MSPHIITATVPLWQQPWRGRTWKEMPGRDEVEKKLEFFLFRRGIRPESDLEIAEDGRRITQRTYGDQKRLGGASSPELRRLRREAQRALARQIYGQGESEA